MSEPVRSIIFFADENGVSPSEPQFAGVQGEHNATEVKFQLSSALTSPEYLYRIEFSDAAGEYDSTDFIPISGSFVNYLLPENWTKAGGVGVIHLCAVVLDANGQEEQEVYSLAGRLKFAPRESGGMKTKYEKGLSALISEAGKATDAANEAAENANAAADRVDESVSGANTAAANANRAAASADASAATANAAAGGAQEAKEAADTAASGANTAAEQARTAAASANTAAGTASTAASNANAVADAVQAKLDAGELKGEKGDTGPQGPQGVSGVYVGSGEMPEGYTVQVDPAGDMLCYTAGESNDRYANVLTGTASGPVAALEDVSPTGALRRAAVLGATTETGTGDKGPDNPYALTGVQPTSLTVCGKNLLDIVGNYTEINPGAGSFSLADDGRFHFATTQSVAHTVTVNPIPLPAGSYTVSAQSITVASGGEPYIGVVVNGETKGFLTSSSSYTFTLSGPGTAAVKFTSAGQTTLTDYSGYIQLEFGTAATPYTPYTGQAVPLPALEPLYGDGTVNDEYDAVSGVETRRWKRVVFDGTEKWNKWREDVCIYSLIRPALVAHQGACNAYPIFKSINWSAFPDRQFSIETKQINFRNDACADVDSWKAYLAAQAAAGTPVTVVYQLAEPVITQHDPARILPPAPVCRVFADAGSVDVGYNRDVNTAFEQQQAEYLARIEALDARITQLEAGQPAEPVT